MIFRVFTFGILTITGVTLGMWAQDRGPPVVIRSVKLASPDVSPGGNLKVEYTVTRLRECEFKVDRWILDSQRTRFVLPDQEFARLPGPLGDDTYRALVPVPAGMAQGPATYHTIQSFRCNLLHQWFWPIVTIPLPVAFRVQGPGPVTDLPKEIQP